MTTPEYFSSTEPARDAYDSTALGGLQMAFEAHREWCTSGPTTVRSGILLDIAGKTIGPGSVGEKSPLITEPYLAMLASHYFED